ncbi:MAG: acyltransferase domain-containing protein [Candidatus Aminicenantes bacterium]|nr:acyltransferase domain-containing protein [Candidatus Aminicenantes bacterium]NIM82455.1 acyltransferase domain-containing protein [Candidatus Aminicenantes bacterium]NIN21816.1 acyltransferase domain-containing protein [Candidatus Aminicenantes bacterium]NIN45608.1 acyltransferase domain-containing protein [Candidatus Aminicenantes bacterium]NIN88439.1 acyltransferase domain-containing protein [Candidatus Aminicenantes bacterium]
MNTKGDRKQTGLEIAVIGMAGRFPGATNLEEFWNNLKDGIESIAFFGDEELKEAGVGSSFLKDPNYVKANGELQDKDHFDNSFFGYSPKEAEIMDPQIRVFHECAWEVLEEAGYVPDSYNGLIGIYAGGSDNFSWRALEALKGLGTDLGTFGRSILNIGFYLSTRVSHKLNLKGPSLTFFNACSTSLVAIHLACRALLMGECDMALAGGVSITNHTKRGYTYEEGMIMSPDGHCRTFDTNACGSVYGEGVGIVALKRFKEAIKDGDTIHAVIKGSAVNNDGINKASFTAPGPGIASIVKKALKVAHVNTEDISYVEAHGTATHIGDTLEVKALKQAFNSDVKGYCRIGSVKTNIGHLDTAAGVAAFIKTILALEHKAIPPSLHFKKPNPDIDFENSPFVVNTELSEWRNGNGKGPLIAGVNGFGIGGTNVFVVLEEAPEIESSPEEEKECSEWKIILLSARSEPALNKTTENFKEYLESNPNVNFADVVYTLQVGRKAFQYRRMLVCSSIKEAIEVLSTPASRKIKTFLSRVENREIIFMFSGLGSQYVNMGLELYQKERIFRQELDRCLEILEPLMGYDIKEILYPGLHTPTASHPSVSRRDSNPTVADINQAEITQPIIFIFEYALAKLLMKWGIKPQAMIGYSFGEYVAAAVSGVFSLEDALKMVVLRGRLIQEVSPGAMLSVPLSCEEVTPDLPDELSLAIDNGSSCVVAGPDAAVADFEHQMKEKKVLCMRLKASRAIHSKMMGAILAEFQEICRQVTLNKPQIPYISNVTGTWISDEEAVSPVHWAKHLRETVRFADGIKELTRKTGAIFVEIGPGRDLSALLMRYIDNNSDQHALSLVRQPEQDISDVYFLMSKLGQLWLYGREIDWREFYGEEKRHRIPLPTYPFQRQQFCIEGDPFQMAQQMLSEGSPNAQKLEVSDWFYVPSWKRTPAISQRESENSDQTMPADCLVFMDEDNWGKTLVKQLENKHQDVTIIRAAQMFRKINNREYTINPADDNQYEKLFSNIREEKGVFPGKMIHLWNVTTKKTDDLNLESIDSLLDLGYYCLLNIARAIGKLNIEDDIDITVVTNNMQEVVGQDQRCPEKATLLGPVKTIPKEYGNISLRSIDIRLPQTGREEEEKLIECLIKEFFSKDHEPVIAFRNHFRWIQTYEPVRLEKSESETWRLKDGGIYLVTGGLGGIGYVLAQQIVRSVRNPKLILTGRTKLPEPGKWDQWLEDHDEEDSISAKITKVRGLEGMGAKVLVVSGENSNLEQMQQVISRAEEQFGPINGVVHSAGLPDGAMIQVRTREQSEIVFSSKLKGTLILAMLLKHVKLDFFVLCSSIDSIMSNAGHVGYCSANSFLNAFATYKFNKDKVFTTAISWPRWQSLGMAVIQENLHKELKGYDLSGGLEIEDGIDAFSRILGENLPQVAVTSNDLGRAYERDKTVGTEAFMAEFDAADDAPENLFQRPDLTSEYVAPQNETQQSLARIWQTLFGIEKIGIQDDFFELGGDSLKVVITISKIHKELDVEIPVSEFFNTPNIQDLAKYMTGDISKDKESTYLSIEPGEKKEFYPLSSAQKRFYIIQQLDVHSIVFNNPRVVVLQGELLKDKLEGAIKQLIQCHEILRSSFEIFDKEPVQRINETFDFAIEYHELPEEETRQLIETFVKPFDLAKVPLFRVCLVKVGGGEQILMFDMHHIITDLYSRTIFIRECLQVYNGLEQPLLRLQYKDFCQWQHDMLVSGRLKKQEEYWVEHFSGELPVLELSTDYPRPEVHSFEGTALVFSLQGEVMRKLNTLMKKTGTTLFMMILALYNILLSKYSGQSDIIIGAPVAGRSHANLENMMGLLIETIVIRNYPDPDQTFVKFLEEVKNNSLEAFDNQSYPFGELLKHLGPQHDQSRNPLFDAMLMVQNVEQLPEEAKKEELSIAPYKYEPHDMSKVDITFEVEPVDGGNGLLFKVEYCTRLFKEETMERFTHFFIEIVSTVVDNPTIKLKDIKMSHVVSAAEADVFEDDGTDFGF